MVESSQVSDPRAEHFGFLCRRCTRCCHNKRIQVNPYEIARLARRFGQSTSAFGAASTEGGAGNYLNRTDSGACVFLGPEGCTVHEDRPLVCRLYPLGRHVSADGTERFSHMTPHPQTESEINDRGTIGEFLATQGAAPFMRAADEYANWVRHAIAALGGGIDRPAPGDHAEGFDLVDMDAAIAAHCAAAGIDEPADIEARKALHLTILYRQLEEVEGGDDAQGGNA
ncbi:MAG TPA: YkgJ family cysteine cluster protein [Stellaceae bacterium]|nr:YkgJ family cysteine cluster protein [Stellaceae bacterium]